MKSSTRRRQLPGEFGDLSAALYFRFRFRFRSPLLPLVMVWLIIRRTNQRALEELEDLKDSIKASW